MRPTFRNAFYCAITILGLLISVTGAQAQSQKLPPEKAGEIGAPTGQIAFVRDGDVWIMRADGSNQMLVSEVTNADGRLSFSPDNKIILFTRSGKVDLRAPDMLGGVHKVYDLFYAYIDSALAGKVNWWRRMTDDLGSRYPEWQPDGEVLFYKDLNANVVNAVEPNYQICIANDDLSTVQVLRKDWQVSGEFMISPTMNTKGDIAFVHFSQLKAVGIAVLNRNDFMVPLDSIRAMSAQNRKCVAPSWSPDGKWLAYISSDMNNAGLFIATPDLKEKYLVWSPGVNVYPNTLAPSWSPDSKWLTFSTSDGSIWVVDITGNNARRLTGPGLDKYPAWSKPEK